MLNIPYHWVEAGKLAKKIFKDFQNNVSINDFIKWSGHKKYEYHNKGHYPFTVQIRHCKKWECYSDYNNDLIKINMPHIDKDLEPSKFETNQSELEDAILLVLVHEITHHLQHYYNLDENLNELELKHYDFIGDGYGLTNREKFLYFTNWVEMDANLSAIHFIKKYKNIDKSILETYYQDWISTTDTTKILVDYIYNYFWNDIKDFDFRNKIHKSEIILN